MQIGGKLANPGVFQNQCFILGSYNDPEKDRLEDLKKQINEWPGANNQAYLMEDFADGLHPIAQFQIIADMSDYVIGVCEHDQGGFQLELGMLLALSRYWDRFHLLKRDYGDEDKAHYNWMLEAGAFELLDYQDSLREWGDISEYNVQVDDLLHEILD